MFSAALKEHEEKHEQIGMRKKAIETAIKLLEMRLDIALIMEATGLSIDDIKNLQAQIR